MGKPARTFAFTHDGSRYVVAIREVATRDHFLDRLTAAQRGVLELIAAGLTNAEIAERRRTSPRTVANQVSSLLLALDCANRGQLAILRRNVTAEPGGS